MEDLVSPKVAEARRFVQEQLPEQLEKPFVGIICGSGLDGLADTILPSPQHEIKYADIPHFPQGTGPEHDSIPHTDRH